MKIYINHYDLSKINIDYDTSYNQHLVYSNEGIFIFKNNKLFKVYVTNEEIEKVKFKDHEFLIDKSEQITKEVIYHIPYEHILCIEYISKKNLGDGITFVKKDFFDQVSYYFEIEGKLESFMFAKMFTFVI